MGLNYAPFICFFFVKRWPTCVNTYLYICKAPLNTCVQSLYRCCFGDKSHRIIQVCVECVSYLILCMCLLSITKKYHGQGIYLGLSSKINSFWFKCENMCIDFIHRQPVWKDGLAAGRKETEKYTACFFCNHDMSELPSYQ